MDNIIIDNEMYTINRDGTVKTLDGTILNQYNVNGYMYVSMKHPITGKFKNHSIHRLLARQYIPNICNKKCVDHKNGIRHDNQLSNLRYCNSSENSRNCKKRIDNVSGVSGVYLSMFKKKQYWCARITTNQGRICKCFDNNLDGFWAALKWKCIKEIQHYGIYAPRVY
jgi:hypothetical protein